MTNESIYKQFIDVLTRNGKALPESSRFNVEEIWYFPDNLYAYITVEVDRFDNLISLCTYTDDGNWIYASTLDNLIDFRIPENLDIEDVKKAALRVQLSLY